MRKFFKTGMILLSCFFSTAPVSAVSIDLENWSFEIHPHPPVNTLSQEETQFLLKTSTAVQGSAYRGCLATLKAGYEIYRSRYPEFERLGDEEKGFALWRKHVLQTAPGGMTTCPYSTTGYELSENYYLEARQAKLVFCGHEPGQAESKIEMIFARLSAEFLDIMAIDREAPLREMFLLNLLKPVFDLNADVEYYILKSLQNIRDPKPDEAERLAILEKELSDERKAFVKQAAAENNLQAVTDTTPACKPY